jgi:hypothetical protein
MVGDTVVVTVETDTYIALLLSQDGGDLPAAYVRLCGSALDAIDAL